MISSQKTKEFDRSDYDGIKRVYSIWICMNMPEDSLHSIHLVDDCAFGKAGLTGGTDLINILFVELAKEVSGAEAGHRLHRLLGALFSKRMAAGKKLEIMDREYAIPLEQDVKEEVNIMCNLGEGIEEEALERGREQGLEQGLEQGREQGLEQGLEQGREQTLLALIKKKIDKGKSLAQIADELEETQEVILPLYRQLKAE